MNEKNYQFLSRALGKLGFEDSLNNALRTKMQLNFDSFDLRAKVTHGSDQMVHELHFDKKKDGEFYFLNNQTVTLTKPNEQPITQRFGFFNQSGFSNEEAYNLMNGRSVRNTRTEDEKTYVVWTYIDFNSEKNKHDNYVMRSPKENDLKFDLKETLDKLPIQSLSPAEREKLEQSLASGNVVSATVKVAGQLEKVNLTANPTMRMINVVDGEGKKVSLSKNKVELLPEDNVKQLPDTTKRLLEKEKTQGQSQGKKIGNG